MRAVAEKLDVAKCSRVLPEHRARPRGTLDPSADRRRRVHDGTPAPRALAIRPKDGSAERPSLDSFSDAEVHALWQKAYPPDRKAARGHRLLDHQLSLLQRLRLRHAPQAAMVMICLSV